MRTLRGFLFVLFLGCVSINAQRNYKQEIAILNTVDSLLADSAKWKKQDKYHYCDNSKGTYTLSCALIEAHDIKGLNPKKGKKLNWSIRKTIWQYRHKLYLHPITYFNTDKRNSFQDVKAIINLTKERLKELDGN